jgi:transmembrane sensor
VSADVTPGENGLLLTLAADWFVRLRSSEATLDDWRSFETWLSETKGARDAFEAVEAAWVDLDDLNPSNAVIRLPVRVTQRRKVFWPALVAAGIGCLVLGLTGLLAAGHEGGHSPTEAIDIAGRGTIRPLGDTKVTVAADGAAVVATLASGEISVSVRHDPAQPVTILAAGERIVDVGTIFNVRSDGGGLRVAVTEGEVAVLDSQPGWNQLRVRRGQSLVRRLDGAGARLLTANGAPISLSYDNAPMTRVAADLNRFYSRPVTLADGAATVRFSGVLRLEDQEELVNRLAAFTDLAVTRSSAGLQLYRPRPSGA